MTTRKFNPATIFVLAAILLIAVVLRLYNLDGVPPGLQHDEVFHAHDAFTVREGYTPLWFSSNAGNEPLYIYLMALTTATIGDNVLGIRFTAVVSGLLMICFTYLWARRAFDRQIALITALMLAVCFWPVWMSRVGLRAVSLPPMVALTSWLYVRAVSSPSAEPSVRHLPPSNRGRSVRVAIPFVLAGAALGLTLYTYPAAFAAPIVFVVLYVYLAIFHRAALKRNPLGHLAFWLAAGLAYLPLGLALASQEGGYLRVQQTAIPLKALQAGDPLPLLKATGQTLLMWTTKGDPLWRYNVSGRPVFEPVLAVVFVLGVLVSIWLVVRKGEGEQTNVRIAAAMIPLWLLIGVAPSAVTDSPPAFLRASPALPATYIALALGFNQLRQIAQRWSLGRRVWPMMLALVAVLTVVETGVLYFITWPTNVEVQQAYRTDLAEVAAYLQNHQPVGGVAISTSEPHHLDRFIFDYTPHGGVTDIHWFDGLNALVAPAGEGESWVFITREPTPGEQLQGFLDQLPQVEDRTFANGERAFALYAIPPGDAFFEQFPPPTGQGVWVADQAAFPPDDPDGIRTALALPVQFGDVAQLVGYESDAVGRSASWYSITLYWRVTRDVASPEPWAIFAHVLDAEGNLIAGRDFLAVPASTWRAGDVFIQTHPVGLPEDVPPGLYHVEIGLYTQADGSRFPIMDEGEPVGDRLLFEPVEVVGE